MINLPRAHSNVWPWRVLERNKEKKCCIVSCKWMLTLVFFSPSPFELRHTWCCWFWSNSTFFPSPTIHYGSAFLDMFQVVCGESQDAQNNHNRLSTTGAQDISVSRALDMVFFLSFLFCSITVMSMLRLRVQNGNHHNDDEWPGLAPPSSPQQQQDDEWLLPLPTLRTMNRGSRHMRLKPRYAYICILILLY